MSFCDIIIGRSCSCGRFARLPAGGFSRRLRLDRERVNGAPEFRPQRRVYHAMALDPALPFEGRRYDIDSEMRLAARSVTRMTLMQMRFVGDVEAFRQESFTQLVCDGMLDVFFSAHGGGNTSVTAFRQWRIEGEGFAMSRLEAAGIA